MRPSACQRAGFAVLVAASFAGSLLGPPVAAAGGKADLVQKEVSEPPEALAAGVSLDVEDRLRNRGSSTAAPSRTGYYLSRDGQHGPSDTALRGRRSVPRLAAGRGSAGARRVEVPVTAPPGAFRLIACADDRDDIREAGERNNCLASKATVLVTPPAPPASCQERLARLGISYAPGPAKPGVADPVTVQVPLNGLSYVAAGEERPQETLYVDCTLALALHGMADSLAGLGITTVEHLGVYDYRCIAGTDPCELSQHAHATAIDLHEFRTDEGEAYNVETDWVIDADPETTCSAPTSGPKDALLHGLVCEWDSVDLFNIILTPNYNLDHRNHFHVDLTPGADFIN